LGDDAPPLRVGELPKPNATKVVVNPLPPPPVVVSVFYLTIIFLWEMLDRMNMEVRKAQFD
jgi:hypothetical protein